MALSSGSNTIIATATDAAGNRGQDHVTVTYRPTIAPPPTAVSVALIGPLRFDGKALLALLRCNSTGGAPCKGAITVTYPDRIRVRVNGKLRTRTVARVIANSHYVLAAAHKVLVSARLNRTGATLLARKHTVKVTVLITVTQPSGKSTVVAKQSPTLTRKKGTNHG